MLEQVWTYKTMWTRCTWEVVKPLSHNDITVDTRRRFNVDATLCDIARRRIDVETTSCVYWFNMKKTYFINVLEKKIKGLLLGLRQFLVTKTPLKLMKNAFYFTLNPLFVHKIFNFLSWLCGHVEKTAWLEELG